MALIVVDTALVFLEHLIEANVFPNEYHAVTHAVHHGCHILGYAVRGRATSRTHNLAHVQ